MILRTDVILKTPFLSVLSDGNMVRITDATNCEHVFCDRGQGYELTQRIYPSKINKTQADEKKNK